MTTATAADAQFASSVVIANAVPNPLDPNDLWCNANRCMELRAQSLDRIRAMLCGDATIVADGVVVEHDGDDDDDGGDRPADLQQQQQQPEQQQMDGNDSWPTLPDRLSEPQEYMEYTRCARETMKYIDLVYYAATSGPMDRTVAMLTRACRTQAEVAAIKRMVDIIKAVGADMESVEIQFSDFWHMREADLDTETALTAGSLPSEWQPVAQMCLRIVLFARIAYQVVLEYLNVILSEEDDDDDDDDGAVRFCNMTAEDLGSPVTQLVAVSTRPIMKYTVLTLVQALDTIATQWHSIQLDGGMCAYMSMLMFRYGMFLRNGSTIAEYSGDPGRMYRGDGGVTSLGTDAAVTQFRLDPRMQVSLNDDDDEDEDEEREERGGGGNDEETEDDVSVNAYAICMPSPKFRAIMTARIGSLHNVLWMLAQFQDCARLDDLWNIEYRHPFATRMAVAANAASSSAPPALGDGNQVQPPPLCIPWATAELLVALRWYASPEAVDEIARAEYFHARIALDPSPGDFGVVGATRKHISMAPTSVLTTLLGPHYMTALNSRSRMVGPREFLACATRRCRVVPPETMDPPPPPPEVIMLADETGRIRGIRDGDSDGQAASPSSTTTSGMTDARSMAAFSRLYQVLAPRPADRSDLTMDEEISVISVVDTLFKSVYGISWVESYFVTARNFVTRVNDSTVTVASGVGPIAATTHKPIPRIALLGNTFDVLYDGKRAETRSAAEAVVCWLYIVLVVYGACIPKAGSTIDMVNEPGIDIMRVCSIVFRGAMHFAHPNKIDATRVVRPYAVGRLSVDVIHDT